MPEKSERILVAVITGGRPRLEDRTTSRYLPALKAAGYDTIWVTREDQAGPYEPDGNPIETFTLDWANKYAKTHWRHPVEEFIPGGFHGAFTGREWAMRLGQSRGYDAVIQLDDNIKDIGPVEASRTTFNKHVTHVEMFQLLAELAFSTNVSLLGMQLNSIPTPPNPKLIRVGYPYSAFIEKTGPLRLPYYGPFEDDIMHALDYGLGKAPTTAALIEVFKYVKHSGGNNGMRSRYNNTRGLGLLRQYPNNVTLRPGRRTSSTAETERGFRHYLNTKNFTPIHITNPTRYTQASNQITTITNNCITTFHQDTRNKMTTRSKPKDRQS